MWNTDLNQFGVLVAPHYRRVGMACCSNISVFCRGCMYCIAARVVILSALVLGTAPVCDF